MSLQEASPSGPFGPKPAQADAPTAESPFQPPPDAVAAQPAPPLADGAEGGGELRSARRRAWTVFGVALIVPIAAAVIVAWQLFGGSDEPAPTITRVATTPVASTESASAVATTSTAATATPASDAATTTASSAATTTSSASVAVETSTQTASAETATAASEPAVDLSALDPEARLAAWPEIESIVVLEGETIWLIAQNYGTTVSAIATLNGITDPSTLSVGQELRVPVGFGEEIEVAAAASTTVATEAASSGDAAATESAATDAVAPAATDDLINWHTIAPVVIEDGDSLAAIAEANDTTVEAIMALNGIADGNTIYADDVLLVPVGYQGAAASVVASADSGELLEEESTVAASDDLMEEEPLATTDSEDDMMSD